MAATFEGFPLTAASIEDVLRRAAHGESPPVRDIDAAQNPGTWCLAMAHAAATQARDALRDALTSIANRGDGAEVKLAMEIQRAERVLDSAALWNALGKLQATDAAADAVLLALVSQQGKGELTYDPMLEKFVSGPVSDDVLDRALILLGKFDRGWLLQHSRLLGTNEQQRTDRIAQAATAMTATELESFAQALQSQAGVWPAAFPLDAMLQSLRRAGLN